MKDVFITDDFLLSTPTAIRLYHGYAENLPVIDYHCHLPPRQVAEDYRFRNLTEIWLGGDHYKWRLMRTYGVDEKYITGDGSDWEKFEKWAEVVPYTLRNPMYHWVHLELKRPFGLSDRLLGPATARGIYEECNARLARPEFSARGIMKQMRVVLVCTTDDPADSLEYHRAVAGDKGFAVKMLPTFRPDKGMMIESPAAFNAWTDRLAGAAGVSIRTVGDFLEAIRRRHEFFHTLGCRLSDHGIETVYAEPHTEREITAIFERTRAGKDPTAEEVLKFKSAMLYHFAVMDCERGWTQQIHYGAMRNNNSRMFKLLGPDTGFDSIGDWPVAVSLSRFLDRLDREGKLPRTILYNLNPRDNELLAGMLGNFQGGGIRGKIQFGSGWWFLDQIDGMTRQMEALSNLGMLRAFVGMLTDSRSFLSYTRHEYFRRLLCEILGRDMERGLVPRDFDLVGGMVRDISYNNAATYFGFDLPRIDG
jgi:glucuronate isomerase